jgi:hypothetical protein
MVNIRLEALARNDYDDNAIFSVYEEALLDESGKGASTVPAFENRNRGAYAGTGYSMVNTAWPTDCGELPAGFGRNNIWRMFERLDTMSEAERETAMRNPETTFGFISLNSNGATELRGALQELNIQDLKDVVKELDILPSKGRGKPALVDSIYNFLTENNPLPPIMSTITDRNQMSILNEIMTAEEPYRIVDSDFPYELGIKLISTFSATSWWDGYDLFISPINEMRGKYLDALKMFSDVSNEVFDRLDECAKASVNLYGIVTVDDFTRLYRAVSDVEDDSVNIRNNLCDLIKLYENGEADFFLSGEYLVNSELMEIRKKEIPKLYTAFNEKPMRILPEDNFLKYADYYYYEETEAHRELRVYAEGKLRDSEADELYTPGADQRSTGTVITAEGLVQEVSAAIRMRVPIRQLLKSFDNLGGGFKTKAEIEEVTAMLSEIGNNTRMWDMGGSTPAEIGVRIYTGTSYHKAEPKIGRNDPCPCGSGKKYKHCCGRN